MDHWHPLITETIRKYCKDQKVIDLGCRTGIYTTLISKYTDNVLGLDISKEVLSYAKNKNSNLNLFLADAHHISLQGATIDTVVCIGLFEYVERATVLKEIKRY